MLTLFGLVFLGGVAPAAEPARKPNVVFILADDLGWADITPYGSTFHDTPNLKRLADRSVRFSNYYAASAPSKLNFGVAKAIDFGEPLGHPGGST